MLSNIFEWLHIIDICDKVARQSWYIWDDNLAQRSGIPWIYTHRTGIFYLLIFIYLSIYLFIYFVINIVWKVHNQSQFSIEFKILIVIEVTILPAPLWCYFGVDLMSSWLKLRAADFAGICWISAGMRKLCAILCFSARENQHILWLCQGMCTKENHWKYI